MSQNHTAEPRNGYARGYTLVNMLREEADECVMVYRQDLMLAAADEIERLIANLKDASTTQQRKDTP